MSPLKSKRNGVGPPRRRGMPPKSTAASQPADIAARILALTTRSPRQAVALARRTLAKDRTRGPEARGRLLRAYGHALRSVGEFGKARSVYLMARRRFRKPGLELERAICAIGLVDACMYLGRTAEALDVASEAERAFMRHGDLRRLAMLETNVGNVHHRLDALEPALAHYKRAGKLFAQVGAVRERASIDHNSANILTHLGRRREAESLYRDAQADFRQAKEPVLAAQVSYGLACLRFLSGEYAGAIAELEEIRPELLRLGARPLLALADLDLADVLLSMRLLPEALALASSAAHWFRTRRVPADQARCALIMGTVLVELGRPQAARHALNDAERLFRGHANPTGRAAVALVRARLALASGRALDAARKAWVARRTFMRSGFGVRAFAAGAFAAEATLAGGRASRARVLARTLLLAPRLPGDAYSRARLARIQAAAAAAMGDAKAALRGYKEAIDEIQRAQSALFVDEWRIGFLAGEPAILDESLGILLARRPRPRPAEVWRWLRRAQVPVDAPDRGGDLAAPIRNRLNDLRAELEACYARLWKVQSSEGRRVEQGRMRRVEQRALVLEGRLRRLARPTPPRGSKSRGVAADEVPLREGEVRLIYFSAAGRIGALRHDAQGWTLLPDLVPVSEIDRLVRLFHYQMDVRASGVLALGSHFDQIAARARDHLMALGSRLLDAALPPDRTFSTLRITPYGSLFRIPFHALPWRGRPLVEHCEVVIQPAGTALRTSPAVARQGACILAHGGFAGDWIEDEGRGVAAELVRSGVTVQLATGAEARAEVLSTAAPCAAVVHLAGHAVYRTEHPEFSALRLADRWVNSVDFSQLPLAGACVVLSACETGARGAATGGEMLGLVRGLTRAGAAAVVASLWRVDDRATRAFMQSFYERWRTAGRLGAALRDVQRLGAITSDTYLWAPFYIVGDPNVAWPLSLQESA